MPTVQHNDLCCGHQLDQRLVSLFHGLLDSYDLFGFIVSIDSADQVDQRIDVDRDKIQSAACFDRLFDGASRFGNLSKAVTAACSEKLMGYPLQSGQILTFHKVEHLVHHVGQTGYEFRDNPHDPWIASKTTLDTVGI